MKKTLSFLFLITLLCSFTLLKTDESDQAVNQYVGIWTEHWGEGHSRHSKTNVNYVDTLKFEVGADGKLGISCINSSNYVYTKINPQKSSLSFLMENIVDPGHKFFVEYSLKPVNSNLIKGEIHNSNNQTIRIALKRFK